MKEPWRGEFSTIKSGGSVLKPLPEATWGRIIFLETTAHCLPCEVPQRLGE
jgi:hypothetical protein